MDGRIHSDRTELTPIGPDAIGDRLVEADFSGIGYSAGWTSPGFDAKTDLYLVTTAWA
jgi:hypothetical protein